MERAIGIDLGTSYTVAAVVENGRVRILPNREGENLTPSVYAERGNGVPLVGMPAREVAARNAANTVSSVKRLMGSDQRVWVQGKSFSPQEISAAILRKVKADAEACVKGPVTKAVITVPAYFHHAAREATREAGRMAGFEVLRIINEPTAAALAYGLHRQEISTVLVWDLGGGTFDVSILELSEGFFEVKAVCGDNRLGGDDWDQRLVDHLASRVMEAAGFDPRDHPESLARVRSACEAAKKRLSEKGVAKVSLPQLRASSGGVTDVEEIIGRALFEEMTADLAERLLPPTVQALTDAGLSVSGIDRVLLVGGATRMPRIRSLAEEFFHQRPYLKLNPDEVVGMGAAIQAGIITRQIEDVVLVDVTPLSLGIETEGHLFARIVPRNTTIPTSARELFIMARDNQTSMDIHVLQGEREMAVDNISLGTFQLSGIPPLPRGQAHVEVSFSIDADGIVEVSAQNLQTEEEASITIDAVHALTEEEISRAVMEADALAEADLKRREAVEAATQAETLLRAVEAMMEAPPLPLAPVLKEELCGHLSSCKEALASGSASTIKGKSRALRSFVATFSRETGAR